MRKINIPKDSFIIFIYSLIIFLLTVATMKIDRNYTADIFSKMDSIVLTNQERK